MSDKCVIILWHKNKYKVRVSLWMRFWSIIFTFFFVLIAFAHTVVVKAPDGLTLIKRLTGIHNKWEYLRTALTRLCRVHPLFGHRVRDPQLVLLFPIRINFLI